jgi:hypothetical protein
MYKYQQAKLDALSIIHTYPQTHNGAYFLTLQNGKKVFFEIFVKKYGLDGSVCKYNDTDIYRRIKIIECFEFLLQNYAITSENEISLMIETIFFRFVIKKHIFRQ